MSCLQRLGSSRFHAHRSVLIAIATILLASVSVPAAAAAYSDHVYRDDSPGFFTPDKWEDGGGGGSGNDGFQYVREPDRYNAYWVFQDLPDAMYRPASRIPGPGADPMPTGWAHYRVQQRGASGWETVESWTIDQGRLANHDSAPSFWYKSRLANGVRLSGDVRVVMHLHGSGLAAADSLLLRRVGDIVSEAPRPNVGNIVDGTLDQRFTNLYADFKRMSNGGHEQDCESTSDTEADRSEYWRRTFRQVRVGRTAYDFPIGECTSWVQFRILTTIHRHVADVTEIGSADALPFDNGYQWDTLGIPWGNAEDWDSRAEALGYDSITPTVNSVAQWNWHPDGHVAFVEWVSEDGSTIRVSEMNLTGRQLCDLQVREISRDGTGVYRWPDTFVQFPTS